MYLGFRSSLLFPKLLLQMFLLWQIEKQGDIWRGHQCYHILSELNPIQPNFLPQDWQLRVLSSHQHYLEWICHALQPSGQTRLHKATQVKLVRYNFNIPPVCKSYAEIAWLREIYFSLWDWLSKGTQGLPKASCQQHTQPYRTLLNFSSHDFLNGVLSFCTFKHQAITRYF